MNKWKTADIIKRLDRSFSRRIKRYDHSDFKECLSFQALHDMKGFEVWFVPEADRYDAVLEQIGRDDVVFDVGAGDLRFDLIMAEKAMKVYAVEINPMILYPALRIIGYDMPDNLIAICSNAFDWYHLPKDVTVVTCLMIHRKHEFPQSWMQHRIVYADMVGIKVLDKENL